MTIQVKATEQYFPVVLFVFQYFVKMKLDIFSCLTNMATVGGGGKSSGLLFSELYSCFSILISESEEVKPQKLIFKPSILSDVAKNLHATSSSKSNNDN